MLKDCLAKAGKAIDINDAESINAIAQQKMAEGLDQASAESAAVEEYLAGIEGEIETLSVNILDQDGDVKEVERKVKSEVLEQSDTTNQTETQAFKDWFGDSKVVDENGEPLVVYHGTFDEFDIFKASEDGGIYFSDELNVSKNYGDNIKPVYLAIKKPLRKDYWNDATERNEFFDEIEEAKEKGHDGLIILNVNDQSGGIQNQYIAFDPTQIKSATGNNGNFDPNDPSILNQSLSDPAFHSKLKKVADAMKIKKGSPQQFLNAIKKQGVKKEEIEWTGLEDFIENFDGKMTKEDLQSFVDSNGFNIDVINADQPGEVDIDDFEGDFHYKVYDDPEAWKGRAEEIAYDAENEQYGIENLSNEGFFDHGIGDESANKVDDFFKIIKEKFPSLSDEIDAEIAGFYMGELYNVLDAINDIGYEGDTLSTHFFSHFEDEISEFANHSAKEEYEQDPYEIHQYKDEEFYIFGNKSIGYSIRSGGLNHEMAVSREEIWSLGEAFIQAREYAEYEGIIGSNEEGGTRWEEYVEDGYEDGSYHEVKITAPDIDASYVNSTHFDDENILVFTRNTVRELETGEIHEDANPAFNKVREQAYFIDEIQSDWHQAGQSKGYNTQELRAKREEAEKSLDSLSDKNRIALNKLETHYTKLNAEEKSYIEDTYSYAMTGEVIEEGKTDNPGLRKSFSDLLSLDSNKGKNKVRDSIIDRLGIKDDVDAFILAHKEYRMALEDSRRIGVDDAPFKGNEWIRLGLKQSILNAVEQDLDYIGWASADMVSDRWSDRYEKAYKNTYDTKVPSMMKKLVGQKPDLINGDMDNPYWMVKLTPEFKEKVRSEGLPLFQKLGKENRGSIELLDDARIIRLTEASDLSTFNHEASHLFLEMEKVFAAEYGISKDQEIMLKWLGVDSFDEITAKTKKGVTAHEKFARGWEAYLYEGKAPSSALREVFRRFKSWMKQIYTSIAQLNVDLNDDIRGVFDRLIASEQEILAAEAEMQYAAEVYEGIPKTESEKATQRAIETLEQKILKELTRKHEKWWKEETKQVKAEIHEELTETPIYKAELAMLGKNPIEGIEKIDRDELKQLLNETKLPRRLNGISQKNGQSAEEVAFMTGFDSAYEMITAIRDSETINKQADLDAETQMLKRHGDIMNDGTLQEEARIAARNEERGKLLLKELREANKAAKRPQSIDRSVLKEAAKEVVSRLTVKQLTGGMVERYHRAEVKSAIQANQMTNDGDFEGAAQAKAQQAFNFYLYREAREARDKVEKRRAFLRKMQNRTYSPKQVSPQYIQHIKRYINAFEFRKNVGPQEGRQALSDVATWLISQEETDGDYRPLIEDPKLAEISQAIKDGTLANVEIKYYKDMTVGEIESVYDQARHLRFIGGKHSESVKQQLANHYESVANSIVENSNGKTIEPDSLKDKARSFLDSVLFHADHHLRRLDGFNHGKAYKSIKGVIDKATTEKLLPLQERVGGELVALYDKHYSKKELRENNNKSGVDGTKHTMNKWERIAVVLNMGNSGNRQALLDSTVGNQKQFTEQDLQVILDSLDKRDMDFVQDVWDYLETFRPEMGRVTRALTGVAPRWVEAEALETKHGTYRGGYYRLRYDSKQNLKAESQDVQTLMKGMDMASFAKAQTKNGSTIERVGSGGLPVRLDMMVLHQHINETVNYIAMAEAVNDSQGVLSSRQVRTAMESTDNLGTHKALMFWLKDAAAGEVVEADSVSGFLRRVRTGFSAVTMGFNVGTMLIQPLGVFQSMPIVGYKNMAKGIASVSRGGRFLKSNTVIRGIQEKSAFMRERGLSFNKDLKDTVSKINSNPSDPGYIPDWFRQAMFSGIVFTQRYVDAATWIGAYEKGKADNPKATESDLIQFADRTVARTQASGNFSDRTPLERGRLNNTSNSELVRIWTALGSYMFAKGNVIAEVTGRTDFKNPAQAAKYVVDLMALLTWEAIAIGVLRGTMPDDDDDESVAAWAAKESLFTAFGTVPFIREASNEAQGFRGGSVLASMYQEFGKVVKQTGQGEVDAPLLKSISKITGMALRLPANQTNRIVETAVKDANGEDVDAIDYLMWREKDKKE